MTDPKNIQGLDDLTEPGIKPGIGDSKTYLSDGS